MERLQYPLSHEWHVAINKRQMVLRESGAEWQRWLYKAKELADEVPRMAMLFEQERLGKLSRTHKQCSHSEEVDIADNHLTCCLGVKCKECPELKAMESIERATPEDIDQAKAWTCAAHIMQAGDTVDTSEGFVLTTGDRRFWDDVYANLASDAP